MLYFSPELGEPVGASFATGLAALYGRMAYVLRGYGSAGESSPDPKSGGYARATEQGHRPAPFRPDAGAQRSAMLDERSIEARDQVFCRSAIFPCQKIGDRAKSKFGAPVGRNFLARQRRDDIHTRPPCLINLWRTLEAGAVDGSIELPRSASPRQRHSQVAMSAKTCKSQD